MLNASARKKTNGFLFATILPVIFVFICLVSVLGRSFTCYIYTAEKQIQPRNRAHDSPAANQEEQPNRVVVIHQGMDLTKQAAFQSILYILSFILVYSGPLVAIILRAFNGFGSESSKIFLHWITSLFFPLGGFFNIVIYTRPKVMALRKIHPEIPKFISFLIIILSGGQVPDLPVAQDNHPPISAISVSQEVDANDVVLVDNHNQESLKSSLARWIEAFGYEISEDVDIDEEIDKVMRGMSCEEEQDNDEHSKIEKFQEDDMNLLSESKISLDVADGISYEKSQSS